MDAKIKKIINNLIEDLGFKTEEEFENSTGFKITKAYSWKNGDIIAVNFKDPFFNSITGSTEIDVSKSRDENLIEYNLKIKYKIRQFKKLNLIKQIGIDKIITFISKSFWIDPKLIKTTDIIFHTYKIFRVGGVPFSYEVILKDNSFTIYTYQNDKYVNNTQNLNVILQYYYKKDISEITKFKIKTT